MNATDNLPVRANRIDQIEAKIDRDAAGRIEASPALGGVAIRTMGDLMEFAKMMAVSEQAVPPHLRGKPGACLAICIHSLEWKMSPYAVANKSYVVNDRISYESQLIHALIEQRAPLVGRLRHRYTGEGDSRRCTVIGMVKGEDQPFEYQSPEFRHIQPKNSPLWKTKPDIQLYYNTSRDWARMYFPDVIMGVYADEELAAAVSGQPPRERGTKGLMTKLENMTKRPLSEGQTLDTDPERNAAAPAPDPVTLPDEKAQNVSPEAEADAGNEVAAFGADPVAAERCIQEEAKDLGVVAADRKVAATRYAITLGLGPNPRALGPAEWRALWEAIRGGHFDYATGRIV